MFLSPCLCSPLGIWASTPNYSLTLSLFSWWWSSLNSSISHIPGSPPPPCLWGQRPWPVSAQEKHNSALLPLCPIPSLPFSERPSQVCNTKHCVCGILINVVGKQDWCHKCAKHVVESNWIPLITVGLFILFYFLLRGFAMPTWEGEALRGDWASTFPKCIWQDRTFSLEHPSRPPQHGRCFRAFVCASRIQFDSISSSPWNKDFLGVVVCLITPCTCIALGHCMQ